MEKPKYTEVQSSGKIDRAAGAIISELRKPAFTQEELEMLRAMSPEEQRQAEQEQQDAILMPIVQILETLVNVCQSDLVRLAHLASYRMHRYLQSEFFMSFVLTCIAEHAAKDDMDIDARNAPARDLAIELLLKSDMAYLAQQLIDKRKESHKV